MHLITAILAFATAGFCLYNGMNDSSWLQLFLAAILTAVGRVSVRRYKQQQ